MRSVELFECTNDVEDDRLHCLIEFEDRAVADEIASDGYIYIQNRHNDSKAGDALPQI